MSIDAREIFAASEIAQAIGWSKPRTLSALKQSPRSGTKQISGNDAPAWSIAALPECLVRELERLQTVYRYRSPGDVLRHPTKQWQPATPLLKTREQDRREAERLREALATALALPEEAPLAERARTAAPAFHRAFGRTASPRHLERLISRTLDRDRGAHQWQRLELYLADDARPAAASPRPLPASAFGELAEDLAMVSNATAPTPEDKSYCWRKVVEFFHSRCDAGAKAARLKRELCDFLLGAAPYLGESALAVKRNLNRKLALAAQEGVAALVDQRGTNSGNRRRPADWDFNIQLFAKWTLARHGRESQAWRELYLGTTPTGEQFSESFREYYGYDVRTDKSRVPTSARDAIRSIIKAATPHQLGPRAARIAEPAMFRDWRDTPSGSWFQQDDATLDLYWLNWHETGEYIYEGQRFSVTRGQWIPMVDLRSDNPLSGLLIPFKSYNSRDILTANARTFLDPAVGMPRKGVFYEHNVWEALRLKAQFSFAQIDEAFARQGISLAKRHVNLPRTKIIERVIGRSHNLLDHLPGWVGNDEQNQRFERVHRFLLSLRRVDQPRKAEVDPRKMLLTKAELHDELAKAMQQFAAEPQGRGGRLEGLSPAEAWKQFSDGRPREVLPDSLRYLLTTESSIQKVGDNGVKVRIGSRDEYYFGSERLSELRGERVRVLYNPELPDLVSVIHPRTDPKGVKPFSVPLFNRLPATTATTEDFARARDHQRAFARFGENSFRVYLKSWNLTVRNEGLGTPELRNTGDRLNAIESAHRAAQTTRQRHRGEIQTLAARHNLDIDPAKVRDPERVVSSLQRADELEEQIRRMEAAEADAENP